MNDLQSLCPVCRRPLSEPSMNGHTHEEPTPKREPKPPVLVQVTVAKIVTERYVMSAESKVMEVLAESVSCPRVLTDGQGQIKALFVQGQVFELRRSNLAAVVRTLSRNPADGTATLSMFDE